MGKITIKVGPKAEEMFATLVTAAALYAGPSEVETNKSTVYHDVETEETYVEVEPQTVVINRSLSQRLAGRIAKFIVNHVEVEKKDPVK